MNFLELRNPEIQICGEVLKHLAQCSFPHNTTNENELSLPTTSMRTNHHSLNDNISHEPNNQVGKGYCDYDDENHQKVKAVLSVLLDSTSAGPDSFSLQNLRWDYGGGAGGGMGNWDACHYIPEPIGTTLAVLQDQVFNASMKNVYYRKKKKSKEQSETRFCTVGGITPGLKPYDTDGFLGPPIAGLCVPSVCTTDSLINLFSHGDDVTSDFFERSSLSELGVRYVSSLLRSLKYSSEMGIVCEGESGLREIDDPHDFLSYGFLFTMVLSCILVSFVLLGTISSSLFVKKKEMQKNEYPIENGSVVNQNYGSVTHKHNGSSHKFHEDKPSALMMKDDDELIAKLSDENGGHSGDFDSIVTMQDNHDSNLFIAKLIENTHRNFKYFDAKKSLYQLYHNGHKPTQSREIGINSAYNERNIVDTDTLDDEIPPSVSVSSSNCLNGMRSISMLWIIFGHTMAVQSSIGYVNPAAVLPPTGMMSSYLGSIILSARYAVDTFFFIGGYLVMSGLLKRRDHDIVTSRELKSVENVKRLTRDLGLVKSHIVISDYNDNNKNHQEQDNHTKMWIPQFLLHRILRILPTYAFVLLLWWKVGVYMGSGPFWPKFVTFVSVCDKTWYTNLLFINNIYPFKQEFGETSECMYHTWYLGVDFQLCAILTPMFLSLYLRKGFRRFTIVLEIAMVLFIILISYAFSFKYEWSAHLFDGKDTLSFDRGFYINPFFRSTPYIIGFVTAQLWHEKSRLWQNMGLTKVASVFLSFLSIGILLFLVLGTTPGKNENRPCTVWESPSTECGSGWSREKLAVFNSIMRPAWSIALAIMSLLSFNGQLWCLYSYSLLNWKGWAFFARLSFAMYLIHPLIINIWVLGGHTSKLRYSHVAFVFAFVSIVVVTVLAALVLWCLVECPAREVTKYLERWIQAKVKKSHGGR